VSDKKKNVLGRGLGALIGVQTTSGSSARPDPVIGPDVQLPVVATAETLDDGASTNVFAHIEVDRVQANPYQPRLEFEPEALRELAQSIRENGLVQPVTVRRVDGGYQLISGERRVRACRDAGITHVPAYIRQVESEEEMIELALIENIQRRTLNPLEIALSYQQLVEKYGHTQEELAAHMGVSRATVANFIRLLKLPAKIQDSIRRDEISMGHARALISVPDVAAQLRIWQKTMRENLSVRNVEDLVRDLPSRTPSKPAAKKATPAMPPALEDIARRLQPRFGTKIHIHTARGGRGSISLDFYSQEDFDRIVDILLGRG
jgi:ParB family transcriptional regulator, chromosome partitioning protein